MSKTTRTFYAARLVDNDYKMHIFCNKIDAENRESIIEAVKEIKKGSHTPEQITGILGVVLANTKELLTEEDQNTIFQGVKPSESLEAYDIEVDKDTYPLLYNVLTECTTTDNNTIPSKQEEANEAIVGGLVEELERLQIYDESVVPFQNLPFTEEDTDWDGSASKQALKSWASNSEEEVDWKKYRKGFLWYDSKDSDKASAHKFPIATIIDGRLTAVPKGIYAAASAINKAKISDEDKSGIRSHITKYYKKLDKETPWNKESKEDPEVLVGKVEELQTELEQLKENSKPEEELKAKIASLETIVSKLSAESHTMLAREASHLAQKSSYPAAKGKSFDELCEAFAARTEESLNDLIGDLLKSDTNTEEQVITVEDVTDPTVGNDDGVIPIVPELNEDGTPVTTNVQQTTISNLTDENEDTFLVFNVTNENQKELQARIAKITSVD